jgi:hypothetical protein
MFDLYKQKGLRKVIEVPFEVTIDKNLKSPFVNDKEIKGPGLLHGRTFKGIIKYDPKNVIGQKGGTSINLTGKNGAQSGLFSITFDFVNLDTGSGTRKFTEKDDFHIKSEEAIYPSLLFVYEKITGLYFFAGDFYLDFDVTGSSGQKPKSKNKMGFGFYENPFNNPSFQYFTFFAKNGTLSSHGKVKFIV